MVHLYLLKYLAYFILYNLPREFSPWALDWSLFILQYLYLKVETSSQALSQPVFIGCAKS